MNNLDRLARVPMPAGLELFYSRARKYQTLGYVSSMQFEQRYGVS